MPDAHTHDIITVVTGVALAVPAYAFTMHQTGDDHSALVNTLVFVAAHCVSGMLFSPDLDLDSEIDNRWGIFFWIWRPYMWAVPHRSRWLSHGLIVPALLRLLYFYVVVVGLLVGGAWALGRLGVVVPYYHVVLTNYLRSLVTEHPREAATFLAGFITGGAAHTIADWLVTGGKHYLRHAGIHVGDRYQHHDHHNRSRRRVRSW